MFVFWKPLEIYDKAFRQIASFFLSVFSLCLGSHPVPNTVKNIIFCLLFDFDLSFQYLSSVAVIFVDLQTIPMLITFGSCLNPCVCQGSLHSVTQLLINTRSWCSCDTDKGQTKRKTTVVCILAFGYFIFKWVRIIKKHHYLHNFTLFFFDTLWELQIDIFQSYQCNI